MSATADHIREAREQKGLTLGQAADATRIPRYYLEILEGGGNDRLVSDRLYMVHFLRSYAEYLEIEADTLAAQFVRENRTMEAASAPPAKEPRSRKAGAAVGLLVLLAVAAGIYIYDPELLQQVDPDGGGAQRPSVAEMPPAGAPPDITAPPPTPVPSQTPPRGTEPHSVLQPEADETAPADTRPAGGPPAADPGSGGVAAEPVEPVGNAADNDAAPSTPASPSTPALALPEAPQETASLEPPAEGTPPAATPPEGAAANAEPAPATTAAARAPAPPPADSGAATFTHTLGIVADARSWLRIWVDDKPSRDLMLEPGEAVTLSADTGFNITFGNAGGVRLTLNDQELPAVGRPGQVVRNYRLPRPGQTTP